MSTSSNYTRKSRYR